jgi:electron transfer flavoprotein beta subunit
MPAERAAGRIINGDLDTAGKAAELVRVLHEEAKVI